MLSFFITGDAKAKDALSKKAKESGTCFRLVDGGEPGAVHLRLTHLRLKSLFTVLRGKEVVVSTWQSEGISHYARIGRGEYLLTCAMMGLLQYKALAKNEFLVEEDFIHTNCPECLFSTLDAKQKYALLFEEPVICYGCLEFFNCLGVEDEVSALQHQMGKIGSGSRAGLARLP